MNNNQTKYSKLIDWIDKNLKNYNCKDVVVDLGKVKYGKNKIIFIKFPLTEKWIERLKEKIEEIRNDSDVDEEEKQKTFDYILNKLKNTLPEREICKYVEKVFWKEKGNCENKKEDNKTQEFHYKEAIKSDNLLCLKNYFNVIGKYSGLRKIYEKLLSYEEKWKQFDELSREDFLKFVFYQSGRLVIGRKGKKFAEIVKQILDEIVRKYELSKEWEENEAKEVSNKIYEDFKTWLSAIIAYYVYYKWTKN